MSHSVDGVRPATHRRAARQRFGREGHIPRRGADDPPFVEPQRCDCRLLGNARTARTQRGAKRELGCLGRRQPRIPTAHQRIPGGCPRGLDPTWTLAGRGAQGSVAARGKTQDRLLQQAAFGSAQPQADDGFGGSDGTPPEDSVGIPRREGRLDRGGLWGSRVGSRHCARLVDVRRRGQRLVRHSLVPRLHEKPFWARSGPESVAAERCQQ